MASFPPDTCVACGGPALPRFTRVVKEEVNVLWTRIKKKKELERQQLNFPIIKDPFMCKTCHSAYSKIVQTEKVINDECIKTCIKLVFFFFVL